MSLSFFLLMALLLLFLIKPMRFFIRFYRRKKRLSKYVSHLPSPKGYPLVGSGCMFLGKSTQQIMDDCVKFVALLKTPFCAWFAGALVLILDHPDDVHTVLTSKNCMEKAAIYKFFNMGKSLFTAPVSVWKHDRKSLGTAFNLKILQSFVPIFNAKVKHLVRNISLKVGQGYFDITPMIHACTLDMICETTLGENIEALNGKNSDYVEAQGNYMAVIAKRVFNVLYHFDFIYKRSALYKMDQKYLKAAKSLPNKVIETRKQAYFEENPMGTNEKVDEIDENDDDHHYETPQILIRQLFRLYSKGLIDDQNIRDQVFLNIFAGNDTSALTLAYTVLLLAIHPQYQERAVQEVDRVFANLSDDEDLTYEHVTKLEYVEQILRETLRLNPTVPYLLRLCTEETKLREDLIIPRDTTVVLNLYTMHRRKDLWGENVDEFDPSRFDADNVKKRNPNAYAPFSLGPRNCIGMRYAYIAMKIILANLLRHYHFTTNLKMSDIHMRVEITLKNEQGNMVQVTPRRPQQKE